MVSCLSMKPAHSCFEGFNTIVVVGLEFKCLPQGRGWKKPSPYKIIVSLYFIILCLFKGVTEKAQTSADVIVMQ